MGLVVQGGLQIRQPAITLTAMHINKVAADNVRRIREEKGLTVAELAERLGVGKHKVYDYERPRKGSAQREFTLMDLFDLCLVLETNLFELLLPPVGVTVDELASEEWFQEAARRAGLNLPDDALMLADRREVGQILFGIDGEKLDASYLDGIASWGRKERARREKIIEGITKEMWERIEEELE